MSMLIPSCQCLTHNSVEKDGGGCEYSGKPEAIQPLGKQKYSSLLHLAWCLCALLTWYLRTMFHDGTWDS